MSSACPAQVAMHVRLRKGSFLVSQTVILTAYVFQSVSRTKTQNRPRMLTGVEVAGLVLAVLPLCIKMIAQYEDEMEPFATLFAYRSQLSKRKKELYCVHVSFTKTIQNLCHNASVADSEQFDEMVKGSRALSWQNNDSERKLQQFLSLPSYEAYRIKAVMICDSMMKLAGILGLDKEGLLRMEGMQGFRSVRSVLIPLVFQKLWTF